MRGPRTCTHLPRNFSSAGRVSPSFYRIETAVGPSRDRDLAFTTAARIRRRTREGRPFGRRATRPFVRSQRVRRRTVSTTERVGRSTRDDTRCESLRKPCLDPSAIDSFDLLYKYADVGSRRAVRSQFNTGLSSGSVARE